MNDISVVGLAEPKEIECSVQVLGDPRLSDPSVSDNIPELERLAAVSPNYQWMALVRRRRDWRNDDTYTIAQTKEGSEEIVVPLKNDWEHTRARDIADDGTFLFEAELDGSFGDGFSRRPVLFKPGDEEPLILPPEYKEREHGGNPLKDNRPRSHTPYCFAPDGTIFGWTHPNYDIERNTEDRKMPHCIWRRKQSRKWTIEYTPDFMNTKWLWPAYNSSFVWCDQPNEDDLIHFGSFDGTTTTTYDEVTIKGQSMKVISTARDGAFLGNFCIRDGRKGEDEEGKPKLSAYTFLVRPQVSAVHIFNDFENNPWLEKMSASGQYVVGSHSGAGHFLMKSEGDGYRYATLITRDWRIEDMTVVTDEGQVFATATCTERKHDCFRLKLPVLLVPQW